MRGFAWFLLPWPLLSLLGFDEIDFHDWQAVVAALLGPPAIGLGLLAIDSEEMTTAGRITGVVGIPLGLIVLAGVGLRPPDHTRRVHPLDDRRAGRSC